MSKFKPDAAAALGRRSGVRNPNADAAISAVQVEEKRRLHVHIPVSLHRTLKRRAADQDRDMTEIVTEALEKYLQT